MLNDTYIFAIDEKIQNHVDLPEHPVETGLPVTDHVIWKPKILQINALINGDESEVILDDLSMMMREGVPVSWIGRYNFPDALIEGVDPTATAVNGDGSNVSITIKEIRYAGVPYVKPIPAKPSQKATTNEGKKQAKSTKSGKNSKGSKSSGKSSGKSSNKGTATVAKKGDTAKTVSMQTQTPVATVNGSPMYTPKQVVSTVQANASTARLTSTQIKAALNSPVGKGATSTTPKQAGGVKPKSTINVGGGGGGSR